MLPVLPVDPDTLPVCSSSVMSLLNDGWRWKVHLAKELWDELLDEAKHIMTLGTQGHSGTADLRSDCSSRDLQLCLLCNYFVFPGL